MAGMAKQQLEAEEPVPDGKKSVKDRLARFGARTCLSGAGFVVKGEASGKRKEEKVKVEHAVEHPVVDLWKEGLRSKKRRSVEEEESPRKDAEVSLPSSFSFSFSLCQTPTPITIHLHTTHTHTHTRTHTHTHTHTHKRA